MELLNLTYLQSKQSKQSNSPLFDMLICPILQYGCEVWEPFSDLNYNKWYDNPVI